MPQHRLDSKSHAGWRRLAMWTGLMAVVWLVVLPLVGDQPAIREYVKHNEAQGIDPSAKFYTELPLMPAVFDRVQSVKRRDEANFW